MADISALLREIERQNIMMLYKKTAIWEDLRVSR